LPPDLSDFEIEHLVTIVMTLVESSDETPAEIAERAASGFESSHRPKKLSNESTALQGVGQINEDNRLALLAQTFGEKFSGVSSREAGETRPAVLVPLDLMRPTPLEGEGAVG
jgi:hypothetical protein